jgi:hypothetical protein
MYVSKNATFYFDFESVEEVASMQKVFNGFELSIKFWNHIKFEEKM